MNKTAEPRQILVCSHCLPILYMHCTIQYVSKDFRYMSPRVTHTSGAAPFLYYYSYN